MLQGLLEVLRNPRLRPILVLNFFNYACTFTVQGLWGGPYLREVHGLSPIAAGNVLLAAVVAYQLGMLAFGPLDRLSGEFGGGGEPPGHQLGLGHPPQRRRKDRSALHRGPLVHAAQHGQALIDAAGVRQQAADEVVEASGGAGRW